MRYSKTTISALVFGCGVFVSISAARADTITVTSDSGGTGGPDCTLRDAITAANTDAPTGGCPTGNGADTVELPVGATITLTEVDNVQDDCPRDECIAPNGLPSVMTELTLNGNSTTVQRDMTDRELFFRIFRVAEDGDLTLNDLIVRGGSSFDNGGGISNDGTLKLNNCTISGNRTLACGMACYGVGAGISNGGTLTMINSTVSGNMADVTGGGISNGGTMNIINSTVSGNTAGSGGAIINHGGGGTINIINSTVSGNMSAWYGNIYNDTDGEMNIINSTISGNTIEIEGGGIFNQGTMNISNSTVSGNTTEFEGRGIVNWAGTLTLRQSIVANNTGSMDCDNDGGAVNDNGYNIVEDGTCISAGTSFSGDPMLGPLQDNGGPTETHQLLPGSPAINAIPVMECAVETDQRGVLRPQGDGCDIGSYELGPCPADFEGDGTVGASDLAMLLGSWGLCDDCDDCPADFNDDCAVNAADLAQLLGDWGPCS